MNDRLRTAVRNIEPPQYLAARVRDRIHAPRTAWTWGTRLAVTAAVVVVCFGAAMALQFFTSSHESYITAVSKQVATIMRPGLGDHIHCSVYRKYPKDAPTVENLTANTAREFRGLISVVKEHVPGDFEIMMAHKCRYRLRPFVHISLRKGVALMSLVIAEKRDGESFRIEGLLPALQPVGIPVYRSSVQQFQIAAFETDKRLVYVISDLPATNNTEMMIALAPGVRDFLNRM